jgi:uncharacterized protein
VRLYVDTSALIKRYVEEAGSDSKHLSLIEEATEIVASVILSPELLGALRRAIRGARISETSAVSVIEEFERNQRDFHWYLVDEPLRDVATDIGWRTGSRGMDSIHLATAQKAEAECFLTADKRQHEAALELGLHSILIEV